MSNASREELLERIARLELQVRHFEEMDIALTESETKYRRLHQSMRDAFVSVAMDGHINDSNRAYQDMLGYTPKELSTLTYHDLTPTCWHDMEARIVREQVMTAGYSEVYYKEYIRKNGEVFPVELRTFLLRDHNNEPVSMWAIVRDVTERKREEARQRQTELKLLEAQKTESLCMMAGGIAHDFNNLLMGILGNVEMAIDDIRGDSNLRETLEDVYRSAQRAADLCRQLLAYTGHANVTVTVFTLSEIVSDVVRVVSKTTPSRIGIEFHAAENEPAVSGDPSQIRQMVLNLVVNAIEAIDSRGGIVRITLGARSCSSDFLRDTHHGDAVPPGDYVWMEVSDTGCGMSADLQRRIFEPFFTTKFTGRGLGLSAALGIINSHKGTFRLNSRPGQGTSFLILLPAADARVQPVPPPSPVASPARFHGCVLLVDDDEMVRALGEKMMHSLGLDCLAANDGIEAVDVYREHRGRVDAVLLDLTMPRMNGAETLIELRRIDPEVKVILCSGYPEADAKERLQIAGKMPLFLQKPYSTEQLHSSMAQCLGQKTGLMHES